MSKQKFIFSILFAILCVSILNTNTFLGSAYTVAEDSYDFSGNDTFATAADMGHGYYPELCQQDDDWYRFYVYSNQYFDIRITFDGAANDMYMQLYDYNQNYITYSDTAMSYEVISFQASYNGYYYIKIVGYNKIISIKTPFKTYFRAYYS